MKLPEKKIFTKTSSGIEESFGIGNIGLIFNILRNKLYSNPIGSVAREIMCNARDAHREVGTPDIPIEVHLPTHFDLNYKIKDYGPGINPDRMSNIFIQYANSTKRDDNIQTGGFGLGAKSPFAYTNQFTIITTNKEQRDGQEVHVKRTYIAYIDETEIGKMKCLTECVTNDPCGTEIVIAVESFDTERFIEETKIATEHWDVKPKFNIEIEYPQAENVLLEGNGWKLTQAKFYDQYSRSKYRESLAIVDGIAYRIKSKALDEFSEVHQKLLELNLRLYFNVGELTLSASREQLQYDDFTKNVLKKRLSEIEVKIKSSFQDKVSTASSYLEACKIYRDVSKDYTFVFKHHKLNLQWNNKEIYPGYITIPNDIKLNVFTIVENSTYAKVKYNYSKPGKSINFLDSVIIINDLDKKKYYDRLRTLFNEGATQVQVIKATEGADLVSEINNWVNSTTNSFDIWLLEPKLLSSISKTALPGNKKPGRKVQKGWIPAFVWDKKYRPTRNCSRDFYWKPEDLNLDDEETEVYYVTFNDAFYKKVLDFNNFSYAIGEALESYFSIKIHAIRSVDIKKLPDNYKKLQDFIKTKYEELSFGKNVADLVGKQNELSSIHFDCFNDSVREKILSAFKSINDLNNPCKKLLKRKEELTLEVEKNKILLDLIKLLNVEIKIDHIDESQQLLNKIKTRYPLLLSLYEHDYYYKNNNRIDKKSIIEYINLVDAAYEADVLQNTGS